MHIHYAELRGPGQWQRLSEYADLLRQLPGFLGAELLQSPEQPGLALLASRWQQRPTLPPLPGAKAWSFEVCARWEPS
ncbi:antibiotic biosynthesis monooxygenase family protein [Deinococcus lacus]|uniref:Antibiotic biosynthesis monooxygenase family protein n=1 Tax=Deinococcus lacus TaxID=392561 RepID=A0ABW1YCH5_9DEIO